MYSQRSCPICRSEALRRVMRDVTFLANLGGELNPLEGIISYRCANGHVCLLLESARLEPVGRTSKSFPFSGPHLQVTS